MIFFFITVALLLAAFYLLHMKNINQNEESAKETGDKTKQFTKHAVGATKQKLNTAISVGSQSPVVTACSPFSQQETAKEVTIKEGCELNMSLESSPFQETINTARSPKEINSKTEIKSAISTENINQSVMLNQSNWPSSDKTLNIDV